MAKRVLLGIDFIGANFPAALYTIQQWWDYLTRSNEHVCLLGVSNFSDRQVPLPGADSLTPIDVLRTLTAFIPATRVVQWTSDIDAGLLKKLQANGIQPQPFYPQFNYGSVVNRLLLLASSHGCDYLVRIDPGTLPPEDITFAELICEHEAEIGDDPRTVVSRRYASRLALRDMFVRQGQESEHAKLVEKFTGIDVHAQVTGGAMLTLKTPGTPAVCFPTGAGLTLVWASDDGVYQVLPETKLKSKMLAEHPVERFDAVGKPKKSTEYYRGILGAVYLHAMRSGQSRNAAEQVADSFVKELREKILNDGRCAALDGDSDWATTFCRENIAPRAFLDAIADGQENHIRLLKEWDDICTLLGPSIVSETSANQTLQETANRRP